MNYCNESGKYVLKWRLKTAKEEHDIKQLGKLFHELRPIDKKHKSSVLRLNLGISILLLLAALDEHCEIELRVVMMLKSSRLGK